MNSSLDNLIKIFNDMRTDGFDTDGSLKWGFYFADESKEKLQNLFTELEEKNYVLEKIHKVDKESRTWTLHASKIDILTPDKLHRRNLAFNELADGCEVELYDGWDVEKVNSTS